MEANAVKDALEEDEWMLVALALLQLASGPQADKLLQERLSAIAVKLDLVAVTEKLQASMVRQ